MTHIIIPFIDWLVDQGFHILYYKSYTSNSIYLKLDYGVCFSIRISDHRGKRHLSYRFNLILNQKGYSFNRGRHFYGPDKLDQLKHDILNTRFERMFRLKENYNKLMEYNRNTFLWKSEKGFWEKCKEYKKGEF